MILIEKMILTAKFKQFLLSLILILTFIPLLLTQKAYAEEVYVYCAADKDNWHWLKNKTVIVTGEWRMKRLQNSFYLEYFKIVGGLSVVHDLQKQCIEEFGQEYKYAQPANNIFTGWRVFGEQNGDFADGIFEFSRHVPRIGK